MSRTVKRQATVSFGLSFLDVLCCGLGAAILLLLVVKHGETISTFDSVSVLSKTITEIQELIAIKTAETTELERIAAETKREIVALTGQADAKSSISRLQASRLVNLLKEVQQQREALKMARQQLAATASNQQRVAEQSSLTTRQQHLTGLMVNNDRVLVLLDASASMLSKTLVEIIRLRASPVNVQRNADKWRSARSTAMWVVDRIPEGASYKVLVYNDKVGDVHGKLYSKNQKPSWEIKPDPNITTTQLNVRLTQLTPLGPTDLKSALEIATNLEPRPLQLILITDGFPTLPGTSRLHRLAGCPSVVTGRVPLLTPTCRESVFENAIGATRRGLRGIRIDVVLFPLEGDSNAVEGYWQLARRHGGRMLSPVPGWPAS